MKCQNLKSKKLGRESDYYTCFSELAGQRLGKNVHSSWIQAYKAAQIAVERVLRRFGAGGVLVRLLWQSVCMR